MTTLSWDALGGDPAPGDPAAYEELARSFSETAEKAGSAHAKLNTFSSSVDESIWSGEAADAFRRPLHRRARGHPPVDLERAEGRLGRRRGVIAHPGAGGDLRADRDRGRGPCAAHRRRPGGDGQRGLEDAAGRCRPHGGAGAGRLLGTAMKSTRVGGALRKASKALPATGVARLIGSYTEQKRTSVGRPTWSDVASELLKRR
jgi:hypothetical protein